MPVIKVNDVISKAKFNKFFFATFLIAALAQTFDGYDASVFGVAVPVLMKSLKLNPTQTGVLASWGMFGMFFGAFGFGVLGDYIGRKNALMLATFMYTVFTGMSGLSSGFTDFAVYRFIAGVGLAGVGVNAVGLVSEYSPLKNRTILTSLVTLGMAVGTVIVVGMGILLMEPYGWRVMFYTSFILVPLLAFQAWLLPDTMVRYVKKGRTDKIIEMLKRADPAFVPSPDDEYKLRESDLGKGRASVINLFQQGLARNTVLFFLILFLDYYVIYGLNTWLPRLMMQHGYTLRFSLFFTLTFNIGGFFGVPFGGWLADKFGPKKAIAAYFIVSALIISSLWMKHPMFLMGVLLFLAGAGQHGVQGLMNAYVVQSYPLFVRSTAMGTTFTVGRFGGVVGPIVLGVLMSMHASLMTNFFVIAAAFVINIFLTLLTSDYTKSADYAKSSPAGAQTQRAHA